VEAQHRKNPVLPRILLTLATRLAPMMQTLVLQLATLVAPQTVLPPTQEKQGPLACLCALIFGVALAEWLTALPCHACMMMMRRRMRMIRITICTGLGRPTSRSPPATHTHTRTRLR
jgi:hypothetical protein